jgi:hypothetical protein
MQCEFWSAISFVIIYFVNAINEYQVKHAKYQTAYMENANLIVKLF